MQSAVHSIPVALTRKQFDDNGYTFKPALSCINWLEAYFKFPKSLPDFSLPPFCQCVCSPKGLFLENVSLALGDLLIFPCISRALSSSLFDHIREGLSILNSFQVWLTLASAVPFGTTTSYGNLAKLSGRPGAAMAVGTFDLSLLRWFFYDHVPIKLQFQSHTDSSWL